MKKYIFILPFVLLLFPVTLQAQEEEKPVDSLILLKAGTQIPYSYNMILSYQFTPKISGEITWNLFRPPYDNTIRNYMLNFGADEGKLDVISTGFWKGYSVGLGAAYHLNRKSYVKLGFRLGDMGHVRVDHDNIQKRFGYSIDPLLPNNSDTAVTDTFDLIMTLRSRLYNVNVAYGRNLFNISNRFFVNAEVGFNKVLGSRHYIGTINRTELQEDKGVQQLYKNMEDDLRDIFWKYGFYPTINLYLVYRLRSCNC